MMNTFKYIFTLSFLCLLITGCKKDFFGDTSLANSAIKAAKLSVLFDITHDNTGIVTITPNGEGAIAYSVFYGDATTTPVKLDAGKSTTHTYPEGVYPVKIIGYNITGQATEITQQLTVSFKAPENLKVTVTSNILTVNVAATAQYETLFKVYYGDSATAVPVPFTPFLEGQTVNHTYASAGTYIIKVVALSGGAATTTFLDTIKIAKQIDLPVSFDDAQVDYSTSDFGGNQSAVSVDPTTSGNKVMKVIKTAGAEVWAGTSLGTPLGFATRIPITSSTSRISVRVYSPAAGLVVKLKIEDHADNTHSVETNTSTTIANQWETLVFDFKNQAPGTAALNLAFTFDKASLFFDFGNGGNGKTYYFDDVKMMPKSLAQINLPVSFDDPKVDYTITDFGGNQSTLSIDPNNSGNNVMKSIKKAGAEVWAGTTIGGAAGFSAVIPISSSVSKMSVKVYSPAAGLDIKLKIEDHNDGNRSVETDVKTTLVNQWEVLVFDFSKPTGNSINPAYTYDKASIFFDFGNAGNGSTYYFDDVKMMAAALTQIKLPVTFDDATVDYSVTDFGNNSSSIVADPTNNSNQVLKTIKTAGAEVWAGTTIGGAVGFSTAIPISSSSSKMSVKVYSPAAGLDIKLKIEDHNDGNRSVESDVKTTLVNQWEILVFDFSKPTGNPINPAYTYDKASIFFDFGNAGNGNAYYFDDVKMMAAALTQIKLPVTFDDATVDYSVTDFGNNSSSIVADPTNNSNQVLKTIKTAGAEVWAGTTIGKDIGFSTPIPISATASKMSVRIYSPAAGITIKLKIEDHKDGNRNVETNTNTTVANQWETLIFDFNNPATGNTINSSYTYDKASLFFDFGKMGDGRSYYTDDLKFVTASSNTLSQINLPVTFDDPSVNYTVTDFGNNMTVAAIDPAMAGNNVKKTTKSVGAETWAGTTIGTSTGFASAIPIATGKTKMSVRIYSPAAGLPIRLKIEDHKDNTHTVETEAITTVVNQWETLTFDFSTPAAGTAAINSTFTYDMASLFFNFGKAGNGAVFYWDDVKFL